MAELKHYGVIRKSGRYPWGSGGDNPTQRNKDFFDYVDGLRKKGLDDVEIAKGMGITTTQLRAERSIRKSQMRAADASEALRLKDKGMSNVAIGKQMKINESSVRALLDPAAKDRNNILMTTANVLKDNIKEKKYLDVGLGTESYLGVSNTKLNTAVKHLVNEGYELHTVKVRQVNTGKYTVIKVLAAPGTTYSEIVRNQSQIKTISNYSEDGGRTYYGIKPPQSVKSDRIAVRYDKDGGGDMDGVIELRRGAPDLTLGASRYAQVRILVDGTHYIKGMAIYATDLPHGVDIRFNTNKDDTGNKLAALKRIEDDVDNPFGSIVRQKHYTDKDGRQKLSPLNIVGTEDPSGDRSPGEEGGWATWSRNLSSQFLSKQSPALAKQQLDLTFATKKEEFDEIMRLTNPEVRKKLLNAFADEADSSAVHLKAAALPRTANHVILPINSLKDNEVYAPNYRNGETVVLVRHPHGGTFEIPELTVNNKNREAKAVIQNAADAIGINSTVAKRLSGADFDGDTVLVIPNKKSGPNSIKTTSPLAQLKDFDPKTSYPPVEGMRPMTSKQTEMGLISNLITDMSVKGASHAEIARAVKHSMVVIDAEKHNLNYQQSAKDNGIKELKVKYQGGPRAGASTLISRAGSRQDILDRRPRRAADGGPVDKETGELRFEPTGKTKTNRQGVVQPITIRSKKMAETNNAFELVSDKKAPTQMEVVYATYANKQKALANAARKAAIETKPTKISYSAKETYANDVKTLQAKLNIAIRNKPLERQAQLSANATSSAKKQANPNMDPATKKKIENQALIEARTRIGAHKERIVISPSEWDAIQAGAVSNNVLKQVLENADTDQVKKLATPRESPVMTTAKQARAKAMLAAGYTQSEVADALGVPTSTLSSSLQ